MSFESYLRHQKRMAITTAHRYALEAKAFRSWMDNKGLIAEQVSYNDMMLYIKDARKAGNSQNTLCRKIRGVKYWFDYRYIEPNPCDNISLASRPEPLPSPLLSRTEIEELYELYPSLTDGQKRDKVMLGVLCFQGVTTGELTRLVIDDIYLKTQYIRVKGGRWSASRSIKIDPIQYELLVNYIDEVREHILKGKESDLFCVHQGKNESPEDLKNYMYKLTTNITEVYPKCKNALQIRASVIVNWLKTHNIREVQYLAGHKHITATERYKKGNIQDLQKGVDQYHPLR